MSIEYTIDIQLTELGFPDILQPAETSDREGLSTSCAESPSSSPTSPPNSHKQRLLVRGRRTAAAKKQPPRVDQHTTQSAADNPPWKAADKRAEGGCPPPEPAVSDPLTGQDQQGEDSDSDDSDVSMVFEEEEADEEEEELDDDDDDSSQSGDFRCSVCTLQLPSQFKLQDHMNLHTGARPYRCAECGKRFSQIENYRFHLRTHAQTKVDRLVCRICQIGFTSIDDLNSHQSTAHLENEFYECDLCKRVFTCLMACRKHVQLHKSVPAYICKLCGRSFPSLKSLARHQKKKCHCNFKCTDCPLTFTKKNALLKHSFSHLGLLPYTCIRCHCHFRLAKLYRQHKCEPERINCVACLREFFSQEDFQQHKRDTGCWGHQEPKADEIRCLECGQKFDTSEELKKHAGAHQRVLKCAECGKGFRSALLLMSHMGGHAGNSPCLCQSCGLGFPHQQNYDSHLKTCGQIRQPVKRQASRSTSSVRKKLSTESDSSNPDSNPPSKNSVGPDLETRDMSDTGSAASVGLWKLTLDKQPPPGVNLVLCLPFCPTSTGELPAPPVVCPTNIPVQEQAASPPVSCDEIKQEPDGEEPLDLSKKKKSLELTPLVLTPPNGPPLAVKREPDELQISEQPQQPLLQ